MRLDPLHRLAFGAYAALPHRFDRSGRALPYLRIAFELTYRCNLDCAMCFQAASKDQGDEMSTEEWLALADRVPRRALVNVTGGEPFAKRDAMRIVDRVLDRHLCTIITNAMLLDAASLEHLVERRLLLLGVSLDGVGAVHDRFRGEAGAFERVAHNLRTLREIKRRKRARLPLVDLKAVVTADTAGGLDALYDLASSLDADFLTLSLPKLSDVQFHANLVSGLDDRRVRTLPVSPRFLDPAELAATLGRLEQRSRGQRTRLRTYPELTRRSGVGAFFEDGPLVHRYRPCLEPWSGMQVAPNGDVYPCLAFKMGSVRTDDPGRIWNGEAAREFRRALRAEGLFPGCGGCCYLRGRP